MTTNSNEARGLVQCVWGGEKSRKQGGGGRWRGGGGLVENKRTTSWLLQPKIAANYDTNLYKTVRSRYIQDYTCK